MMISGIKWGFVAGLLCFLWLVLEMQLGFHDVKIESLPAMESTALVIPILCIILGQREARNKAEIHPTYWELFGQGVYITAFYVIFNLLANFIFVTLISPLYFEKMMYASVKMATKNGYDLELVRKSAQETYNLKGLMKNIIIGDPLFGVVASLIGAYIVQRKHRLEMPKNNISNL